MAEPNVTIESQLRRLIQLDEAQLLDQLGSRAAVIQRDAFRSEELHLDELPEDEDLVALGIGTDMKAFGGRVLRRWNRSAYEILCGDNPSDAGTRAKLKNAIGLGDIATAGVLTTVLLNIGLSLELAPIVAAIIVKKFFNPAYEEFCICWREKLPTP
jgi:hypothetical protein